MYLSKVCLYTNTSVYSYFPSFHTKGGMLYMLFAPCLFHSTVYLYLLISTWRASSLFLTVVLRALCRGTMLVLSGCLLIDIRLFPAFCCYEAALNTYEQV